LRADDGAIASPDESYPFENVERLAVGVNVPVGSRSRAPPSQSAPGSGEQRTPALPPDRLFMTFLETTAMSRQFREAEAVLLAGSWDLASPAA
jgi:hypothetical protein